MAVAGKPTPNSFIRSYGLFWRREEVTWSPGPGNGGEFRLLGRLNERKPALQIADFRDQRGIYVLYDHYGPYCVGLARDRAIGERLRDHTRKRHADAWDRFSWFGFRSVLSSSAADKIHRLGKMPASLLTDSRTTIADIEALLMVSLGTITRGNWRTERFKSAECWEQIPLHEVNDYYRRTDSSLYVPED